MVYTLSTWALALVGAALIGFGVGWLVRSLGATRNAEGDAAKVEVAQLRAQLAVLSTVRDEKERLQVELEHAQAVKVDLSSTESAAAAIRERDEIAERLANQTAWIGELRVRLWNSEARVRDLQAVVDSHVVAAAPPEPDLFEAARVLGIPVRFNDLTVIEGVGPAIAQLCITRGITTWWSLANADLELLRSMLAEAGPKFQVHDPTSWPQQARLLANGQWEKFRTLAQALRTGSTVG